MDFEQIILQDRLRNLENTLNILSEELVLTHAFLRLNFGDKWTAFRNTRKNREAGDIFDQFPFQTSKEPGNGSCGNPDQPVADILSGIGENLSLVATSLLDKVRSKIVQDKQTENEPDVFDVDMTDDETSETATNNADQGATPCDLNRQSNEASEPDNGLLVSPQGCPAAADTTESNEEEVKIVYEKVIKKEPPDVMESTLESDARQEETEITAIDPDIFFVSTPSTKDKHCSNFRKNDSVVDLSQDSTVEITPEAFIVSYGKTDKAIMTTSYGGFSHTQQNLDIAPSSSGNETQNPGAAQPLNEKENHNLNIAEDVLKSQKISSPKRKQTLQVREDYERQPSVKQIRTELTE